MNVEVYYTMLVCLHSKLCTWFYLSHFMGSQFSEKPNDFCCLSRTILCELDS